MALSNEAIKQAVVAGIELSVVLLHSLRSLRLNPDRTQWLISVRAGLP
ncbi:hypothetical protein [Leptolyngbya ohadii]|nr:hypothetical protein [Leptolyngbya ohadii]